MNPTTKPWPLCRRCCCDEKLLAFILSTPNPLKHNISYGIHKSTGTI